MFSHTRFSESEIMSSEIVPVAETEEQAKAWIGRRARFNPEHSANEDDAMIGMIGSYSGEIVDSYMVGKAHALAVEFMTPFFSGMVRAVAADRFLVKADS
jgi:hypothetical protein